MINLDNLPTAKIEPFSLDLDRPLSKEEIHAALDAAVCCAFLPSKDKDSAKPFDIPLSGLFRVEPDQAGLAKVQCEPDQDAIDDQAVLWCVAMTKLPPKSLPRTQRPIINILKRLPTKPTGNPSFDKGRRIILDRTNLSLWPAIVDSLSATLKGASAKPR